MHGCLKKPGLLFVLSVCPFMYNSTNSTKDEWTKPNTWSQLKGNWNGMYQNLFLVWLWGCGKNVTFTGFDLKDTVSSLVCTTLLWLGTQSQTNQQQSRPKNLQSLSFAISFGPLWTVNLSCCWTGTERKTSITMGGTKDICFYWFDLWITCLQVKPQQNSSSSERPVAKEQYLAVKRFSIIDVQSQNFRFRNDQQKEEGNYISGWGIVFARLLYRFRWHFGVFF